MTQSTPERAPCAVCGKECSVNADGTIRHHTTNNPDWQANPEPHTSNKCKGAGQPPVTPAGVALAEDMDASTTDTPQCRLCKHPVELTGNGRVRSHLTPEATPRPCPAGSDFPLGTYPDIVGTTDGLVASLAVDCGHVPAGQCYACYAAEGAKSCPDHGDPIECTCQAKQGLAQAMAEKRQTVAEAQGAGTAPWGVAPESVVQPTMADQFNGSPLAEALARETSGVGTVLDAMDDGTRTEAERFMGAAVPAQPTTRVEHVYVDSTGVEWRHPGLKGDCRSPDCADPGPDRPEGFDPRCDKCNTDDHRCPGCGTDVRHGVAACDDCERELLARKLPAGRTEDGRRCEHHEAVFGIEDDRLVCVACGTPCTHPDGFTENDPVEDDGEGLVFRCALCGAVDSGGDEAASPELSNCTHPDGYRPTGPDGDDLTEADALDTSRVCPHCGAPEPVGPDPALPGCPAPETHRAGCGCPDDDSRDPADAWRTPDDTIRELMPENVRDLDAMRLDCVICRHPVTPLVGHFDLYGKAASVQWVCEPAQMAGALSCDRGGHECKPDTRVRVGDLEHGDVFVRRGTAMRVTSAGYGLVEAIVVDNGPHAGRTGELKNPDEVVERIAAGPKEQETKECTDDRMPQQRPASSAASTPTTTSRTTAPVPGSPQRTKASAQDVSPKSESVTSSAPTARAAGKGGSAAVTTDQSAAAAAFLSGGRPSAPARAGTQDQSAAAAQFLAGGSGAHGEKETDRDRYDRYLILHPDTGKEKAWTRATTFAKSISDTYALSQWGLRMALLGATMRPDIVKRAHGKHVRADKKLLDDLTAELKTAAGDKVAANLGTSMHSFTELADRAWHTPDGPRSVLDRVPPDCRDDVETYIRLLEETGLEPVPHLIEFTTLVKQYGVAGTSDNCYRATKPLTLRIGRAEVRLEPGEYVIGDKKTGRDLDYGWQEIAIQLAVYAQGLNTVGRWDRTEKKWYPDPLDGAKVRLDAGIVIHLPVDRESEKTPTVYGIDLESGWNAAVLCERVRAWRNVRTLASPVMVSEAEVFAPSRPAAQTVKSAPVAGNYDPDTGVTSRTAVRPPTFKEKASAVTSKGDASAVWQEATAAGLSQAEVDELVAVMQARLRELTEPGG